MIDNSNLWKEKNATLSDKSAEKEYGISRKEILDAINAGELQCREQVIYGAPWYRLLRVEVEHLVEKKFGVKYLRGIKVKKELLEINKELKSLKNRVDELEKRKTELLGDSED